MLDIIKRGVTFFELMIGVFLPWRLRCKYSEFLMRIEGMKPINFNSQIIKEKERNFEKFLHLGTFYAKEGRFELAIESLNKALEVDPANRKAGNVCLLLSNYYKCKGELDKSIDKIVDFYRIYKDQRRNGKSYSHN